MVRAGVIGLDLGGTKIAAALFQAHGEPTHREAVALEGRTGAAVGALLVLIAYEVLDRIKGSYENYPRWAEFLGGWLILAVILVTALLMARSKGSKE